MNHTCPVCGFADLLGPTHDEYRCGLHEICPSCGVQFGYDDANHSNEQLRDRWIGRGAPWHSKITLPPADWDPAEQLRRAGHEDTARRLEAQRVVAPAA